jgi:3-hydroxymyristoyl/3-hydroxydecanoyl-(acyl carrier protein) dehydratase
VTPGGSFAVPAGHPMFAGHFPGNPIVPGAYLLALVQRHADDWLRAQARSERVAGVASAKFLRPLRPDEQCTIAFAAPERARLRFRLEVAGAPCASGTLMLDADRRG